MDELSLKKDQEVIIIEEKLNKFSGEQLVRRYERRQLLGKGGFARCYELLDLESKKISAVKIVQKSSLTKSKTKQKVTV